MLKETKTMDTKLRELLGRKIIKIYINEEYLRFDTQDGPSYTYSVDGDCCSHSSFYDFYGVANLLKNGPVTEIKEVDLKLEDYIEKGYQPQEEDQFYGYQLTTESPEFGPITSVFSFRNVSNGWYGGDINVSTYAGKLPEITEDIVEVK